MRTPDITTNIIVENAANINDAIGGNRPSQQQLFSPAIHYHYSSAARNALLSSGRRHQRAGIGEFRALSSVRCHTTT